MKKKKKKERDALGDKVSRLDAATLMTSLSQLIETTVRALCEQKDYE